MFRPSLSSKLPKKFKFQVRMLFFSDTPAPLNSRLSIPKTASSLLPKLSLRSIPSGAVAAGAAGVATAAGPGATGPTAPDSKVGPVRARLYADPDFYRLASTEHQVVIDKAVAEEQLQAYFSGRKIVPKGPLPVTAASPGHALPSHHTAAWHVLNNEDDTLHLVYVYAHVDMVGQEGSRLLMDAVQRELKTADGEGRLRGRLAFGIVQGGLKIAFFEYHGEMVGWSAEEVNARMRAEGRIAFWGRWLGEGGRLFWSGSDGFATSVKLLVAVSVHGQRHSRPWL